MTNEHIDDRTLIIRLRDGDVPAFTSIVRTYGPRLEEFVYRLVHERETARDIVQDVFTDLWEMRGEREIRTTLQGYLYGSARNHALVVLRRARLEERCVIEFLSDEDSLATDAQRLMPDAIVEHKELEYALAQALATLSPRVRHVALLRWRDKLSRIEIAATLGVAVSTINNQLTSAAKILRPLLTERLFRKPQ